MLELLSRRPMYGYELVQAIKEESHGELEFGEGCIYPLLHKLEARAIWRRGGWTWAAAVASSIASRRMARNNGPNRWPNGRKSSRPSAASCKEASMNTNTHEPLEGMVADLIRRGLPADYAQRAAVGIGRSSPRSGRRTASGRLDRFARAYGGIAPARRTARARQENGARIPAPLLVRSLAAADVLSGSDFGIADAVVDFWFGYWRGIGLAARITSFDELPPSNASNSIAAVRVCDTH